MKKTLCLSLILCMLLSVIACKSTAYSNNVDPEELMEQIARELPSETHYVEADDDYLDIYLPNDEVIREQAIYYATDGNKLDEFGLFHVTDGNEERIAAYLEQYLTENYTQNEAFYNSYIPEETPKLKNAEVKTYGNYVAYAILDDEGRNAFFTAVENGLK